eukprot:363357-Chlamydomonas_euryale.AAC.3
MLYPGSVGCARCYTATGLQPATACCCEAGLQATFTPKLDQAQTHEQIVHVMHYTSVFSPHPPFDTPDPRWLHPSTAPTVHETRSHDRSPGAAPAGSGPPPAVLCAAATARRRSALATATCIAAWCRNDGVDTFLATSARCATTTSACTPDAVRGPAAGATCKTAAVCAPRAGAQSCRCPMPMRRRHARLGSPCAHSGCATAWQPEAHRGHELSFGGAGGEAPKRGMRWRTEAFSTGGSCVACAAAPTPAGGAKEEMCVIVVSEMRTRAADGDAHACG